MTNDERMTKSENRNARVEDWVWDDSAGVVREEPETKRVYDLEERTASFGEAIIDFARTIAGLVAASDECGRKLC